MNNPLRTICRLIALRRDQSKTPHCISPLSIITHATVLVDPDKEDSAQTCSAVKQFFEYKNIELTLYCPAAEDLNFIGAIKKSKRKTEPQSGVELFICLIEEANFLAEYESRRSKAAFKVGRQEFGSDVYDMTLLGPNGESVPQLTVFASAKDYLNKIR